ncbi:hypothetical protein QUF75_06950 [Desulfococcaceae bacterium HSG7]|nr:hypothetical protein [Desulfococcaceae bacterium HSG7]
MGKQPVAQAFFHSAQCSYQAQATIHNVNLFDRSSEACNESSYSNRNMSVTVDIIAGSFYRQALRLLQSEINFDTECQLLLEKPKKLEHYKHTIK